MRDLLTAAVCVCVCTYCKIGFRCTEDQKSENKILVVGLRSRTLRNNEKIAIQKVERVGIVSKREKYAKRSYNLRIPP